MDDKILLEIVKDIGEIKATTKSTDDKIISLRKEMDDKFEWINEKIEFNNKKISEDIGEIKKKQDDEVAKVDNLQKKPARNALAVWKFILITLPSSAVITVLTLLLTGFIG